MTSQDKSLEELDKLLFETERMIETGSDEERFNGAFQTIVVFQNISVQNTLLSTVDH